MVDFFKGLFFFLMSEASLTLFTEFSAFAWFAQIIGPST